MHLVGILPVILTLRHMKSSFHSLLICIHKLRMFHRKFPTTSRRRNASQVRRHWSRTKVTAVCKCYNHVAHCTAGL